MSRPDYAGYFLELSQGVRRPLTLDDELDLLTTKSGGRLSLKEALKYPDFDTLCFDCPWLGDQADKASGVCSPLVEFLKDELV